MISVFLYLRTYFFVSDHVVVIVVRQNFGTRFYSNYRTQPLVASPVFLLRELNTEFKNTHFHF